MGATSVEDMRRRWAVGRKDAETTRLDSLIFSLVVDGLSFSYVLEEQDLTFA